MLQTRIVKFSVSLKVSHKKLHLMCLHMSPASIKPRLSPREESEFSNEPVLLDFCQTQMYKSKRPFPPDSRLQ